MRAMCLLAVLAVSGCAYRSGTKFTLKNELPLLDRSAVQQDIGAKHFTKVIVLRPSGTDSSSFEGLVADFEREFLRHGVTVISGAVTGRVVLSREAGEPKTEAAAQLTDIERALVMARGTGAEAILQIGRYDRLESVESRFLIYDEEQKGIREVFRDEYVAWRGSKKALNSSAFVFAGRLIDVLSGEVVASFHVACASSWSLPTDLVGEAVNANWPGQDWSLVNTNFPWEPTRRWDLSLRQYVRDPPEWQRQGSRRCGQRIIERLIRLSLSKEPPPAASSPSPTLDL